MTIVQTVILVAGMLIAGLGSYLYMTNRNAVNNLTMNIEGTVTSTEEKPVRGKDKKGNTIEGIDHLTFFEFDINGETYQTARITRNRYQPGNAIKLRCNPENMKNVEEAASVPANGKMAGGIMMIAGMAAIAATFVFI